MAELTDFAAIWSADIDADQHNRVSAETDLAFWREHAACYDQAGGNPDRSQGSVKALMELTEVGWSILDIGCGTGRFAVELALAGREVIGLDHCPDMLTRAQARAAQRGARLHLIEGEWPYQPSPRVDCALVAWALYRSRDLLGALTAIRQTAKKRIVLIDSLGYPVEGRRRQARGILLAGALVQIGLAPNISAVWEPSPHGLRPVGVIWADTCPPTTPPHQGRTYETQTPCGSALTPGRM